MVIVTPPPPEPVWIAHFLSFCHQRQYTKGSDIIHQGAEADTLYYLTAGSVAALMVDADGRQIILAYLNKGDFIGEMGLFLPQPRRSVVVRARSHCHIAEIAYPRLAQLFDNELKPYVKDLLFAIAGQLSRRLINTSRKVGHLAFFDVTGRIARTLLDLCQQPDAITHPDGMQIRITRQEIGQIVGCSREMAGRVLKHLEGDGLIQVTGKTIVVFGTR